MFRYGSVPPVCGLAHVNRIDLLRGQIIGLVVGPEELLIGTRLLVHQLLVVGVLVLPPVAPLPVEHAVPDVPVAADGLAEAAKLLARRIHPDDRPLPMIVDPQQGVAREQGLSEPPVVDARIVGGSIPTH